MTKLSYKRLLANGIDLIADNEIFTSIPNWNHYYISNHGRLIHESRKKNLNIVKPSFDKNTGYKTYTLSKPARYYSGQKVRDKNGRIKQQRQCISSHRLVAIVYVSNDYPASYRIEDMEVHHVNGNRTDNRDSNLLWVTSEDHGYIHTLHKIELMNTEGSGIFRKYNIKVAKDRLNLCTHDFVTMLKMAKGNGMEKFQVGKYWIKATYKNEQARAA